MIALTHRAAWRPEVQGVYKGIDPQKVAEDIMSIGDSATPEEIVDKARDEDTELHRCFEWDDAKAAERYRLQQARHVVRSLVIEEHPVEGDEARQPMRFLVQPEKGAGYKPTELVFRNDDEYRKLLEQAMCELRAFKQKYARLSELQEIFDLIA